MRVGFFINQLDNRGTGNAVYDYAHYNEVLLGNQSLVFTLSRGAHHQHSVQRFTQRFPVYVDPHPMLDTVDVLYHIKSGGNDGLMFPKVRYAVHAVFDGSSPHGHRYAAISEWLGRLNRIPYVPHIVTLPEHADNMRLDLGIPDNAVVFGRYGAMDTFDIPWVWSAVQRVAGDSPQTHFLLANTDKPSLAMPENVHFTQELLSSHQKRKFINTCNAMLHARARGETFGISVAEFAYAGKPVLTYSQSPERAHIEMLESTQGDMFHYSSQSSLEELLRLFIPSRMIPVRDFTPEVVMAKFKEVFLD